MQMHAGVLSPDTTYTVEVRAQAGNVTGWAKKNYTTNIAPECAISADRGCTNYQLHVHPTVGIALVTEFDIHVVHNISDLSSFAFGYLQGGVRVTATSSSRRSFVRMTLPQDGTSTIMTLFVEVILPIGVRRFFYKNITLSATTATVSTLNSRVLLDVGDDLNSASEIADLANSLQGSLSSTEKQSVIDKMTQIIDKVPDYTQNLRGREAALYPLKVAAMLMQTDAASLTNKLATVVSSFARVTTTAASGLTNETLQYGDGAATIAFDFCNNVLSADMSGLSYTEQDSARGTLMNGLRTILHGTMHNHVAGNANGFVLTGT